MHLGWDQRLGVEGAMVAVDRTPIEELRSSLRMELVVVMVDDEGTVVT